jgi:beta-lactamase class A
MRTHQPNKRASLRFVSFVFSILAVLFVGCGQSKTAPTQPIVDPTQTPPAQSLKTEIETAIKGFEGDVGVFVQRLDNSLEVAVRADETFPTASLIKVPILLKLLHRLDEEGKKDKKDRTLTLDSQETASQGRFYLGEDILARFGEGQKISVRELVFLMESMSDNTASLWCQELAGGGQAINDWLQTKGYAKTRVNSRTPGREKDREAFGWGQTTPREIADMLVRIRQQRAISKGADAFADRVLGRTYWVDESCSSIPPDVHVISKQGAVNQSRSEVLLVSAPSGPFVLSVITKNQKDMTWTPKNAGFRLLRIVTAIVWRHLEPRHPYRPALDGAEWP